MKGEIPNEENEKNIFSIYVYRGGYIFSIGGQKRKRLIVMNFRCQISSFNNFINWYANGSY